ncbi:hypothetical protein PanWU01x14_340590 [Parasponia andersonii]|uniref:Uncharacterized protein n=1 Tax=Parasponia andersonii TaxID=3476 RepID=A0A2P5AEF8_PARAD|nr:hypothetical protein PanWU01x14_340590 [Parasponia andersonii]
MDAKGNSPFVKNMKATLGTGLYGDSVILGTNEARQNNSASSMLWISLASTPRSLKTGGGGAGDGDCCCGNGGNSKSDMFDDDELKNEQICDMELSKLLKLIVVVIPRDKPMRKEMKLRT